MFSEGREVVGLGELELTRRLLKQFIVDPPDLADGALQQAGRGEIVDLPRHTAGEVVNRCLHAVVKQLGVAAGLAELEVDVAAALITVQRAKLVADRDAIDEVGMLGAPQRHVQWFLAHQQDLQGRSHVECRTDQQPQVRQRLAVE